MNNNQTNHQTPAERQEQSAQQALIVFFVALLAAQVYRHVETRRWRRGKTMETPARLYLCAWTAGWLTAFANALLGQHHYRISHDTALDIIGLALALWIVIGVGTWIAWILTVAVWESVVWITHTDATLTANRRGHWATLPECQQNKTILQQRLWQQTPNLTISALLAAAGDGGVLLGLDAATAYTTIGQPWLSWNQAETQLRTGHPVWVDHFPPQNQTFSVVIPYIKRSLAVGCLFAWIGCLQDLPGTDPLVVTAIAALILTYHERHRIRSALTKTP